MLRGLTGIGVIEAFKALMLFKDLELIRVFLLETSNSLNYGASFATLDVDLIHINFYSKIKLKVLK